MFKINKLKLDIQANKNKRSSDLGKFGFEIPFNKGLNVIKGENTSGKSTIISCLFYGLCLEQMLGSVGLRSLDKSLKNYFEIEDEKYNVASSYVYIEIENDTGEIYTLKRSIKGEEKEEFTLKIIEGRISDINSNSKISTVFIHRLRNHESELSYFKWFSNFIGFKIPKVINQKGDFSSLYIQTIFPAFFIEQTKGWSDFLASSPYFSIKNNNQRTIEYTLGLNALQNEVNKDKLEIEEKEIEKEWSIIISKLDILAKENMGKITNSLTKPNKNSSNIDLLSLKIRKDINSKILISIPDLKKELELKYDNLKTHPKLAQNINDENRCKLESKKEKYQNYKKNYNSFEKEYQAQKKQLVSYNNFLNELDEEIEINKDIRYLTKKDPEVNNLEVCPTCRKSIGTSIINTNLDVELKTINGNIAYLENQKKLLTNSVISLNRIIEEKILINKLFINDLNSLEEEIKTMHNEFCDPDKMPSRSQIYQQIKTKIEIDKLNIARLNLDSLKKDLNSISERYIINQRELDKLDCQNSEDINKLNKFQEKFKDYLFKFGYKSNSKGSIYIQQKYPFKYFPVSKIGKELQKIQISSSSSDYIRAIWAYTISLMKNGVNHSGIIMFDEPSQHSMKRDSLEILFKELSEINDKQIIVAASTEEHRKAEDNQNYSIDETLKGLKYNVYEIKDRAIQRMD